MVRECLSVLALAACLSTPAVAQESRGAQGSQGSQGSTSGAEVKAGKPTAIVNLNTATSKDLATLPGIGAKTAERIVEYRQKNGPFKKIEELMNVQGIGEKSFLKLKAQLTVATKPAGPGQAN